VLLDFPMPRLLVYPRETVVAEKLDAIVQLGTANSRMKDFYDLFVLARGFELDGALWSARSAPRSTGERRRCRPSYPPASRTHSPRTPERRHSGWRSAGSRARTVAVMLSRIPVNAEIVLIEERLDILKVTRITRSFAMKFVRVAEGDNIVTFRSASVSHNIPQLEWYLANRCRSLPRVMEIRVIIDSSSTASDFHLVVSEPASLAKPRRW